MISRRDRGSASIWLLGAGFVVVAVGLASALATAATTARHRAQAAADLGALAGARYVIDGAPAACARAGLVVSENGARMASCRLDALDIVVTAEVAMPGFGSAREVARAGPLRTMRAAAASDRSPGSAELAEEGVLGVPVDVLRGVLPLLVLQRELLDQLLDVVPEGRGHLVHDGAVGIGGGLDLRQRQVADGGVSVSPLLPR